MNQLAQLTILLQEQMTLGEKFDLIPEAMQYHRYCTACGISPLFYLFEYRLEVFPSLTLDVTEEPRLGCPFLKYLYSRPSDWERRSAQKTWR